MVLGNIAMLVGALDPLEGSLLILPGSALVALGAYLGAGADRRLAWRLGGFGLIAFGVGAMFALSSLGGFGGGTGRSMAWGLLILPYLAGWSLGIWGPGNPRWVAWAGLGVGLWYLLLPAMVLARSTALKPVHATALLVIAGLGVVTLSGCSWRLRNYSRRMTA
jgi:hypothetical protein